MTFTPFIPSLTFAEAAAVKVGNTSLASLLLWAHADGAHGADVSGYWSSFGCSACVSARRSAALAALVSS